MTHLPIHPSKARIHTRIKFQKYKSSSSENASYYIYTEADPETVASDYLNYEFY
ncbi:uncharacterized protein SPAPADRAFT_63804 [Spathaspora passalidarum NRRL Y-27907]|uniref:Uncharacterized protein n=1 Tax=Spathaspora passalidarum (strain NRRL Y-27907 / 11-Y1) TaxID=619300 RepID=G3AVM6_SPAPN|nr:uncharacterized protein SPAPADRAFT_63804 [Spathaspora passalidarum NRRL Y-27907]EGW30191.1 hypothetical protein SPAPADRAFT_63804 [Spathaspora passalidarum NRRL Y-27907]